MDVWKMCFLVGKNFNVGEPVPLGEIEVDIGEFLPEKY